MKMSSVASHLQVAREGHHEDAMKKGSDDEENTEDEEMEQEEYVDIENSEDEDMKMEEDAKIDMKPVLKTDEILQNASADTIQPEVKLSEQ